MPGILSEHNWPVDSYHHQIVNGHILGDQEQNSDQLAIAWINLTYSTSSIFRNETKTILNGVSGYVEFGRVTGLMGPSGAGKSTLLNCLIGRNVKGLHSCSQFYLNTRIEINSCFIVQNISDHILNGLTTFQSLVYSSKLNNCGEDVDHKLIATELLAVMDLNNIKTTVVDNCSGGELKRLAIGLELTKKIKPNLICIDEPTSGLDSFAAEIVIQNLKQLSRSLKIAIITSIHQPNNEVVQLFDKLYVLAKEGSCVYEGPPQQLRTYLTVSQLGFTENQVPIEFLIKLCSKSDGSAEQLAQVMRQRRDRLIERGCAEGRHSKFGVKHKKVIFNFKHFWYLLCRESTRVYTSQLKTSLMTFLLIQSTIYIISQVYGPDIGKSDGCDPIETYSLMSSQTCDKKLEPYAVQNTKYQIFVILLISLFNCFGSAYTFSKDYVVFKNQINNGWFSPGSFYWAKTLSELPLCLLNAICISPIAYYFTGQLNESFRFWWFTIILTACSVTAQGIGLIFGTLKTVRLITIMIVAVFFINMYMSGAVVPVSDLPTIVDWLAHSTFLGTVFELILLTIFGFDRCPGGQLSSLLCQMNLIEQDSYGNKFYMLIGHLIIYRIIALFLLVIRVNV